MSRKQLRDHGMTTDQIDHAREVGRLHDLHRGYGIYSILPRQFVSADGRLRAALLATGGRAVVSHGTAAHRWNLVPAPPIAVELSSRLELIPPRGVVVHRTKLRPTDVCEDAGLNVTTVERTLLDLAVRYEPALLLRALQEAEFHHRRRPADILAILRRGHPGSAKLRAALDRHVPGYGEMRSRLERRFRALLVRHGVALPLRNVRIGFWTVDCFWPELMVIVELDGGQHREPGQASVDAERDLWLRRHGYVVRRYTWAQVTGPGAADVIADLVDAFAEVTRAASERGPIHPYSSDISLPA